MESEHKEASEGFDEWTYEKFKRYLLEEKHLPYEKLPAVIQIGDDWHTALNKIVKQTVKEGKEWAYAIDRATKIREARPRLFLHGPEPGSKYSVYPPILIVGGEGEFMQKHNLASEPVLIGSVHTHTTHGPLWSGDLAPLLQVSEMKVALVSIEAGNFLSLKSEKTPFYDTKTWDYDQYEQFREEIQRHDPTYSLLTDYVPTSEGPGGRLVTSTSWGEEEEASLQGTRKACRHYKIGLYFGEPGEPLRRIV